LIEVQNRIVDARFRDSNYRSSQNYVGETVTWQKERIHFACPKPEDLADLMDGLTASHERMNTGGVSAVIQAAAIAYGFVFFHPFEDGNGRIHRFLIHNILARRGFTPEGVMFPISATMLKNPADYEASLEAFSRQLMPLVKYSLDEDGCMTVHNDTAIWYRYIDMTPQAEALFSFIDQTIDTELASELAFLANYDKTKKAIQEIVDMPDRQIDLFIRFCLQNNGRLSAQKRASHFDFLSDEEIASLEQAVQSAYGSETLNDG
jgi:Fic family protein